MLQFSNKLSWVLRRWDRVWLMKTNWHLAKLSQDTTSGDTFHPNQRIQLWIDVERVLEMTLH